MPKKESAEARRKRQARAKLIEEHQRQMRGRPSDYEPELAAMILDRLASGESLIRICEPEGMPHRLTVLRWARGDCRAAEADDFRNKYTRAREDGLRYRADEILEIADEASSDRRTVTDGKGNEREVVDYEHIQRSKLRCDVRQWEIGRLLGPYRDKQEIAHTGNVVFVSPEDHEKDEDWSGDS